MALACVALALIGCTTDGDLLDPVTEAPTIASTPSPTESVEDPSTYPTAELPVRLSDLVADPGTVEVPGEFTHDGAEAFVLHVVDAASWAYATGDATYLERVCSPDSKFCQSIIASARIVETENTTRYGGQSAVAIDAIDLFADDSVSFIYGQYDRAAYVDLDLDGVTVDVVDASSFTVVFQAEFVDGGWLLIEAGQQ